MRRIRRLLLAGSLVLASVPIVGAQTAHASPEQTYLVVYNQQALPAGAVQAISLAGGTVVATYDAIGVAVVRSSSTTFSGTLIKDTRIEGVSATAGLATHLNNGALGDTAATTDSTAATPPPGDDNLSALQWDM